MEHFLLINDFKAAGLGLCQIHEKDVFRLNNVKYESDAVKVIMGPGTGMGQAALFKSPHSPYYEVISTEGGHKDFTPTTEEDWKLQNFAKEYLATSNHFENQSKKNHTYQKVSVENLCAGPAVPLIYEFYKTVYPDLPRILEGDKPNQSAENLRAGDIIKAGIEKDDPLCVHVIHKFVQILANEVGNLGLQFLPYGGIFITGGVTNGIASYI